VCVSAYFVPERPITQSPTCQDVPAINIRQLNSDYADESQFDALLLVEAEKRSGVTIHVRVSYACSPTNISFIYE
jgi:hypothetical protein